MARSYDEILKDMERVNEEINRAQKHYRELNEGLNESKQNKAQKLFEKLNECIDKMNELGYNITVCVDVGGEEHWCEWDYSFIDIDMYKLG